MNLWNKTKNYPKVYSYRLLKSFTKNRTISSLDQSHPYYIIIDWTTSIPHFTFTNEKVVPIIETSKPKSASSPDQIPN